MNRNVKFDLRNYRVSVFECVWNSGEHLGIMTLDEIFRSQRYKELIEYYRTFEDKKVSDAVQIKMARVPAYTPNGVFPVRCKDGLEEHNGLLCLDFDNVADPEALKRSFEDTLFVAYAALSISGDGVFALIPIADPTKHEEYFQALKEYFAGRGVEVDKQCSDVSRLRCASYDPAPYINENVIVWDRLPQAKPKPSPKQVRYNPCDGCNVAEKLFFVGLEFIEKYGKDITDGRTNWLAIGSFIKSEFGERGRDYFHRVSCFYPDYKPQECDKLYNGCAQSGYGVEVFLNACSRAGMPRMTELLMDKRKGYEL
ncbi:MAG: BT4734/BF3469 family protein [Rikenellaceae bacterium]